MSIEHEWGGRSNRHTPVGEAISGENGMEFSALVERSRKQAHGAINNAHLVSALREEGHAAAIADVDNDYERIVMADEIIEKYPSLLPEHIEDPKERQAFVVALCLEIASLEQKK